MRKLSLALTVMACSMTVSAQISSVPSSWDGQRWTDQYMGKTWNKTWQNGQLVASTDERQAEHWMADLPDNMFVAHVSIPGAHDFATGEENWAGDIYSSSGNASSTTQAVTMREQLDRGIRGIDLRPGLHSDDLLYCYHGIARTTKKLEEAVDDMVAFLQKHPKEFFVVHFFRGNVYNSSSESGAGRKVSDADRARYNSELKRIFEEKYGQYVVNFEPNLTVKEARGKMVLFTRDRISFVHLDKQARITNWDTEFPNQYNPAYITNELNADLTTKLHVQDISEGNDDVRNRKIEHCKNLMAFTQAQPTPMEMMNANGVYRAEWVMNFTSIDNSGTSNPLDNTNGYKGGASVLNPNTVTWINEHKGAGPLGIFFSDYVLRDRTKKHSDDKIYDVHGDELVYAIIENNFAGENPPVVKYAIDENQDWDKLPENPYDGKKFFLLNVGATETANMKQYFGGGANWGGHGVVNDGGLAVDITLDKATGRYFLKTNRGYFKKENSNQYYCDGAKNGGNNYVTATFSITTGRYDGQEVVYLTDQTGTRLCAYKHYNPGAYVDAPQYYVDPEANADDNNPYQMWVLVPYDDRVAENTSAAKRNHPMDVTYLIPNANFGNTTDDYDGDNFNQYTDSWTLTCEKNAHIDRMGGDNGFLIRAYNVDKGSSTLTWNCNWNSIADRGTTSRFYITGTIPSLPAGKYRLVFQSLSTNQVSQLTLTASGQSKNITIANNNNGFAAGEQDANAVASWFAANESNGRYEVEFEVTGSPSDITLYFARPSSDESKTSATSFYLANLRLYDLGDGQDNTTTQTVTVDFPNVYNTLILPFDAEAPEGLEVYKATGHENREKEGYQYHLISLSGEVVTQIKANTPYIVKNPSAPEPPLQAVSIEWLKPKGAPARVAEEETETTAYSCVKTFSGVPTNYHNTYFDGYLTGTIEGSPVNESHYDLGQNDYKQAFFQSEDPFRVDSNRAFVYGHSSRSNADRYAIFFDEDHVLTGVEDVAAEEQGITDETPVDVYTTGGVLLRSQVAKADALTDLPRGIYILAAPQQTIKVAR